MKYRIIKRPSNQTYYIQTLEQKPRAKWQDYDGEMGEPNPDWIGYFHYRYGFFSLRKAKRALERIRRQAELDARPDEVVWEDND